LPYTSIASEKLRQCNGNDKANEIGYGKGDTKGNKIPLPQPQTPHTLPQKGHA
jgi:hypothetical protein